MITPEPQSSAAVERELLTDRLSHIENVKLRFQNHLIQAITAHLSVIMLNLGKEVDYIKDAAIKQHNGIKSGFFQRQRKNKIHPELKELPPEQEAEYLTAKNIIFDMISPITGKEESLTTLHRSVLSKAERVEVDLENIQKQEDVRLEKHWNQYQHGTTKNNALFSDLSEEEIAEKKLLGKITNKKILKVLNQIPDILTELGKKLKSYTATNVQTIDHAVEEETQLFLTKLIHSPIAKYLTAVMDVRSIQPEDFSSQTTYQKVLTKANTEVQKLESQLSLTERLKADLFKTPAMTRKSPLNVLLTILPESKYEEFVTAIEARLRKVLNVNPDVVEKYRRPTL